MRRSSLLLLALFASGCFLDRNVVGATGAPDAQVEPPTEAGLPPGPDAGPDLSDDDASTSVPDADVPPVPDAGRDAGPPDAGCSPADTRCEGDIAYVCGADGVLADANCAMMDRSCYATTTGPRCGVCMPGTTQCVDGISSKTCAEDASGWEERMCPRGCAGETCRPETTCSETIPSIAPGDPAMGLDLCAGNNDADYADAEDECPNDATADGEDAIVRLNIARDGHYCIAVRDTDSERDMDTVVYVRRNACDGTGQQLGCDDEGGGGHHDSELRLHLAPGDYFVVVDSFDYWGHGRDHGCGVAEVQVTSCPEG